MTEKKKLFSLIPQVEVSMVREIKAASKSYRSSEEVAGSEFADSLLKSDREKFLCLHLNVKNQIISFEVVSTGSLTSSIVHLATKFFAGRGKALVHLA
jgi:DNA repair protein RadC